MRNRPRALVGAAATAAAMVLVLLLTTVNGLVSASEAVPLADGVIHSARRHA